MRRVDSGARNALTRNTVAVIVTMVVAASANAQVAVIVGVVADTAGAPVSAAQITLNGTRIGGITNERRF